MRAGERYLAEQVVYGGEAMSRGKMIADLQRVAQASGHPNPQACVDAYLRGQFEGGMVR